MKPLILSEEVVKKTLSLEGSDRCRRISIQNEGTRSCPNAPQTIPFHEKNNGDLRTMLAYLEENDVVALKVVNSHPENRKRHGLPTVMATIILIDPKTVHLKE